MKKILIFSVVVVGILISPRFSHASILVDNMANAPIYAIASGTPNPLSNNYYAYLEFGTSTASYSGDIWIKEFGISGSSPYAYTMNCIGVGNGSVPTSPIDCGNASYDTNTADGGLIWHYNATLSITAGDNIAGIWQSSASLFYGFSPYGYPSSTWTFFGGNAYDLNIAIGCVATTEAEAKACSFGIPPTPPATTTINVAWPVNGSTVPMFDNFWITATGLETSTIYTIGLIYDWVGTVDNPLNSPAYLAGTGQSIMHGGRTIPYQPFMGTNVWGGDTRAVNVEVGIWPQSSCGTGQACTPIASTTISFNQYLSSVTSTFLYITPFIPTSTTSSTNGTYIATTTPTWSGSWFSQGSNPWIMTGTSTWACKPAQDWTDIGGGIVYGACVLTIPPQSINDYVGQDISKLEGNFPFSLVFNFANTAQGALANTSGTDLYDNMALTFPASMGQPTTSIEIMNSHMLKDQIGQDKVDYFFGLISKMLWFSTAIGSIIIVFT